MNHRLWFKGTLRCYNFRKRSKNIKNRRNKKTEKLKIATSHCTLQCLEIHKSSKKSFTDGTILALVLYCYCFAFAVFMLAACIYIYVPDIQISDEMIARAQARERHQANSTGNASSGGSNGRRGTIDGIMSIIRRNEQENEESLHPPEVHDDPPSYIEVCGEDQDETSRRPTVTSVPPSVQPSVSPPAYSDK